MLRKIAINRIEEYRIKKMRKMTCKIEDPTVCKDLEFYKCDDDSFLHDLLKHKREASH